jgi:hypothetical protein
VDDDDVVDRLRGLAQDVAREEDGFAARRVFAQERAQPADPLRIEAVQGLVQNQDLRIAEQGRGEPEPLPHPSRIRSDPTAGHLLEPDEREHLLDATARQPRQGRE